MQSSAGETRSANSLLHDTDESLSQTGRTPRFQTQLKHQQSPTRRTGERLTAGQLDGQMAPDQQYCCNTA